MTFVLVGRRGSRNSFVRKELTRNENLALQALFPLPRGPHPARELSRKFRSLGLPPLLFPALQVHLVLCPGRLPPLPLGLGRTRRGGGGVSLDLRLWCASTTLSLLPLRELERGKLLVRDGLPLPAPLPRLLLPAHRSTLRDVMSREKFRRTAPLLDPPAFPVSLERGTRKYRRARSQSDSSHDRGRRPRSRSSSRSRSRGRERRRRSSSRSLSSRKRSRSLDRSRSRRVRSGPRGDRSRSSDRYRSRRDRSRHDRSRSSDRYRSRRQRARSHARREARGHAILHVALVTARRLVGYHLSPLIVRGLRREDDEPDVSDRRVWRRWKSPRLLLSLKRLL